MPTANVKRKKARTEIGPIQGWEMNRKHTPALAGAKRSGAPIEQEQLRTKIVPEGNLMKQGRNNRWVKDCEQKAYPGAWGHK